MNRSFSLQCFLELAGHTKNVTTLKQVFRYSFNVCKFLDKKNGAAFVIKFVFDILLAQKDAFMSCPVIKKGHYRFNNFTFNGLDLPLAEYLLRDKMAEEYILEFHLGYKTKVKKKFEDICYVDCTGKFRIK